MEHGIAVLHRRFDVRRCLRQAGSHRPTRSRVRVADGPASCAASLGPNAMLEARSHSGCQVSQDLRRAAMGNAVMARPAIAVASRDAQPDRNWPSTSLDRARMMMSRMSGGAVMPLKMAAR